MTAPPAVPPDLPLPPALALDRRAGELVLIVDDVPENLSLLHDALDEAGYTVLVATDGPGALARARQARPDIVLLDAVMPGMDGFAVARELKAQPETAAIPIVFMTAFTETERVVEAYAAGGVDYVTKPIQPREVLARIAAHTRAARAQRQARQALDAFGHASLVLRLRDGRLVWQTALARHLLREHFGSEGDAAPAALCDWARREAQALRRGEAALPLVSARGARRLTLALHPMPGAAAAAVAAAQGSAPAAGTGAAGLASGAAAGAGGAGAGGAGAAGAGPAAAGMAGIGSAGVGTAGAAGVAALSGLAGMAGQVGQVGQVGLAGMAGQGAAAATPAETDDEDAEWLIVASESDDAALLEAMMRSFRLTAREAEVLLWVVRGKTNRDIGDILGASARTVTKHMEHILDKLGVETRTAAASVVMTRLRGFDLG